MNTETTAKLRLEHTFAAPPEDVFDAWTNPDVLTRWWAAYPGWTSAGCEVDLRVGGRYMLRMRDEHGQVHTVAGEYREVRRPQRLVYTWCWERDELHPGHVSVVSVQFDADADAGGTRVVLEHSDLASEESRVRHSAGWSGTLRSLARRVFDDYVPAKSPGG